MNNTEYVRSQRHNAYQRSIDRARRDEGMTGRMLSHEEGITRLRLDMKNNPEKYKGTVCDW